jgi:MscS family membrane protein
MRVQSVISISLLVFTAFFSVHAQTGWNPVGGADSAAVTGEDRQKAPSGIELLNQGISQMVQRWRTALGVSDGGVVRWDSNESPRSTVFTFIQGMHDRLYRDIDNRALIEQTLPEGYGADNKASLALKSVFDRLGSIRPSDLPTEDPDSIGQRKRYEIFPYAVDHQWVWSQVDEPPSQKIVVEKNDGGEWRFTDATLREAPKLLSSLASIPPAFNGAFSDSGRSIYMPTLDRSPWWAWFVALVSLVLAICVGRSLRKRFIQWGDALEQRTRPIIGSLVRSIATSIGLLAATILFIFGSTFVELAPVFSSLYWQCIKAILLVAFVWVLIGLTDLVATLTRYYVVKDDHEFGAMTVTIIQRVIRTLFFLLIAFFILENVFGFSIGSLLLGFGILGLALSLAGKETAQNLFGAISIFINRPFVVGDWVSYKDEIGEVADVRMQATHIRLLSGEMLIVPNMQFISTEVENLAMRKYLRREMNIAIPYASTSDQVTRAMEILNEILRSEEVIEKGKCNLDECPPVVSFSEFGEYYLNLKTYYWYFIGDKGEMLQRNSERGWFSYLEHCSLVNQAILEAFNAEDIKFAFPTQTVALGRAAEGTLQHINHE